MKHRNKRIGLNSDLFTHLRLFNTDLSKVTTRPAWAGFKTAEEGRTKIM